MLHKKVYTPQGCVGVDTLLEDFEYYFCLVTNKIKSTGGAEYVKSQLVLPISFSINFSLGLDIPMLEERDDLLSRDLNVYIKDKHSQEECVGFIDGYNKSKDSRMYSESDMCELFKSNGKFSTFDSYMLGMKLPQSYIEVEYKISVKDYNSKFLLKSERDENGQLICFKI